MRGLSTLTLLGVWLIGTSTSIAQTPAHFLTLEILDSLTRQPIELATVRLLTQRKTLSTNQQGQTKTVSVSGKLPLSIAVEIRHLNYYRKVVSFDFSRDTLCQLVLRPYQTLLQEVIVKSTREQDQVSSPTMSSVRLSAKQIENIPSIGGEKDVIKALLLLPGVKTETEGSSSFNVRGGGSDQNLLLLNGTTLYSSNHLFGLLSTFNTDIIRDVTMIRGAFPAQYGGRLSSVLDVRTRDGDYERLQVRASASLLAARASIEIPLIQQKLSLIAAGRRTYIDALFPTKQDGKNPVIGLSFYDINAKLSWRAGSRSKFTLFGYADQDQLNSTLIGPKEERLKLYWRNQLASIQWDWSWSATRTIATQFSLSDYQMQVASREIQLPIRDVSQNFETSIRDLTYRTTIEQTHRFGQSVMGLQYTHRLFRPNALAYTSTVEDVHVNYSAQPVAINEVAIYADNQLTLSPTWRATAGLRAVRYEGGGPAYLSVEPRVSFVHQYGEHSSVKFSYARMQQAVHQLSNPGLGIPIDLWVPANQRVAPQTAQQVALGYFRSIPEAGLAISSEIYYKKMKGIISYLDGKSSNDVASLSPDQNWENVVTTGQGQAWGGELLVEKKSGDLTGWVGYTLSYVRHQFDALNQGQSFYPRYDKRHELSVVANYKLSSRWRINASWVFSTGQPVTLPLQAYRVPDFTLVNSQIPTRTNGILYVQGDRNSFRMIPFHRLNVAIQSIRAHRWGQSTFEVGLYNAYNRQNPFYYFLGTDSQTNAIQLKSMSLFPVLPGISYSLQLNTH